jgi:hypothetical protein
MIKIPEKKVFINKQTIFEEIEIIKSILKDTLKSHLKEIDENHYLIKKTSIKITIDETIEKPFIVEQKGRTNYYLPDEMKKIIFLIDKNFKIAKTTHIGVLKTMGVGHNEKEEYFYETKNYWVTWWGRKFSKDGYCIKEWSRDHILMETLREREEKT